MSSPSPRGHRQTGGTCWFHAALNGLLMSPRSRRILRERNSGGGIFWNYIRTRLNRGNVRSMTNRNVIESAGLRNRNACVRGGTLIDLYRMYDTLFPWEYKVSFRGSGTPTFVLLKASEFVPIRMFNGYEYKLSHSYILMNNPITRKNHAVAGFMENGNPKIYDSATNRVYSDEDWTLRSFSTHRSRYTRVVYKVGIYVRT